MIVLKGICLQNKCIYFETNQNEGYGHSKEHYVYMDFKVKFSITLLRKTVEFYDV